LVSNLSASPVPEVLKNRANSVGYTVGFPEFCCCRFHDEAKAVATKFVLSAHPGTFGAFFAYYRLTARKMMCP
jgi:hypothetical protein